MNSDPLVTIRCDFPRLESTNLRQNRFIGRKGERSMMMGQLSSGQERLFYSFNLEDHIPAKHLLRSIDQCLYLSDLRHYLADFYSPIGRPSIDPELMTRRPCFVAQRQPAERQRREEKYCVSEAVKALSSSKG